MGCDELFHLGIGNLLPALDDQVIIGRSLFLVARVGAVLYDTVPALDLFGQRLMEIIAVSDCKMQLVRDKGDRTVGVCKETVNQILQHADHALRA